MKREVIFKAPNSEDYRIVCRYGYDSMVYYAWWCHIQKKVYYKKWIFWGEKKFKWQEVDRCWWSKDFESINDLEKSALKFFDRVVLLIPRLTKKAMEL